MKLSTAVTTALLLAIAAPAPAGPGTAAPQVNAAIPSTDFSTDYLIQVQSGPDFLEVANVPSGDTLSIRSGPGTGYRIVARAPNRVVFRNLGCGNGWCQVESRDGRVKGWASQRYLRESSGGGSTASNDVPRIAVRNTGEIEVRWSSGCTMLYNSRGNRLQSGSSCSRSQRERSDDAVARYLREQQGSNAEGGGAMDMRGFGQVTGGGVLSGRITSRNGRSYALILSSPSDRLSCTGSFSDAPGSRDTMTTSIRCTNGSRGSAILHGKVLTFSAGGKGGYVHFN